MINKVEKLIQDYKRETDNLKKISILVLIKNELDMVAKEIAKKVLKKIYLRTEGPRYKR